MMRCGKFHHGEVAIRLPTATIPLPFEAAALNRNMLPEVVSV
jgi:hypothetical protein